MTEDELMLRDVVARSGVSAASIKFYQREGLFPRPRLLNQTTGVYAREHLDRLALIRFARSNLSLPLPVIRRLVELVDDDSVPAGRIMHACQELASGRRLPADLAGELTYAEQQEPVDEGARARAAAVCEAQGWSLPESLMDPLASVLAEADELGIEVDDTYLGALARGLAPVAELNLVRLGESPSRDLLALGVLRGVFVQNRLVVGMVDMVHVAHSVTRPNPAPAT